VPEVIPRLFCDVDKVYINIYIKYHESKGTAGGRYEGLKIARKLSRELRRSGRAAEIGGAGVMQRVGAAGGPGPIGFQGPPRSLKISPVNIQDEPTDPTQSKYTWRARDRHRVRCFVPLVGNRGIPEWEGLCPLSLKQETTSRRFVDTSGDISDGTIDGRFSNFTFVLIQSSESCLNVASGSLVQPP